MNVRLLTSFRLRNMQRLWLLRVNLKFGKQLFKIKLILMKWSKSFVAIKKIKPLQELALVELQDKGPDHQHGEISINIGNLAQCPQFIRFFLEKQKGQ